MATAKIQIVKGLRVEIFSRPLGKNTARPLTVWTVGTDTEQNGGRYLTIPPPCLLSLHILRPAGLLLPLFLTQDTVNALSDLLGFFHFPRMTSPSAKALTAEIEALLSEKNAGYTGRQEKKRRVNELLTIKRSIGWVHHATLSSLFLSAPSFCAVWAAVVVLGVSVLRSPFHEKHFHRFVRSEVDVLKYFGG